MKFVYVLNIFSDMKQPTTKLNSFGGIEKTNLLLNHKRMNEATYPNLPLTSIRSEGTRLDLPSLVMVEQLSELKRQARCVPGKSLSH